VTAAVQLPHGGVHTPSEPITCRVCAKVDQPAFSLLADGQIGPSCQSCGAEQGIAIIGGQARGMTEKGAQIKEQTELAAQAAGPTSALGAPRRLPPAKPVLRSLPSPAPATDEWSGADGVQRTPESVIDERIASARLELARLQVDQCRMLGLEAEVKALEKQRAKLAKIRAPLT
jgi:hypothetical protein